MRTIYYRSSINVLDSMRENGEITEGLSYVSLNSEISKVVFEGQSDISTLKEDSVTYARNWGPAVRLLQIPEEDFLRFLIGLGANNDWWMLRFWDLRPEEGMVRTVSAGREYAGFYAPLVDMLADNERVHEWAGVEVTPPERVRVGLYRFPTASISVRHGFENDSRYLQIEEGWENFLMSLNLSDADEEPSSQV